jgi:hypothetical protein
MLVPSDEAWEVVHRTMGSAFKKLFMGEYSYNVSDVIQINSKGGIKYFIYIFPGAPNLGTPFGRRSRIEHQQPDEPGA